MNELSKVPPQNLAAELSILGGVLLDNEAINVVIENMAPSDFYQETHRKIFNTMSEIYDHGDVVDLLTLNNALKGKGIIDEVGGPAYIASLADGVAVATNIGHYAKIVKEMATRRAYISAGSQIINSGYDAENIDDFISFAEGSILNISNENIKKSFCHVKRITKDSFNYIENLFNRKSDVTGIPTGFKALDFMTSGFQKSDLIIIAGRPSSGKTALCLNLAMNALEDENTEPVAIFSLEMSKEQLVVRLLCSEAKVDAAMMRRGHLKESDWPRLTRAAGVLCERELYIDDTPSISVAEVRAKVRRLKTEKGLGMIAIDYLQLMSGDSSERREQEISKISRALKGLAKELDVPVVALSQLSRAVEQRGGDKRPMLSDLRESGAIEQDSDVVMFVYREETYNKDKDEIKGIAEIIIGKQRNGPVGTTKLAWLAQYTRFENLADDDERNKEHWQD